jgi:hypothetical protein
LAGTAQAQHFDIKEYIFDGASSSPDVHVQGVDMHSFYDGEFIWYPYADYTEHGGTGIVSYIIKFDPVTAALDIYPLEIPSEGDAADEPVIYQAIQGNDFDTIWLYSTYTTRALWKFNKQDKESDYISMSAFTGTFGGKVSSMMIGGVEHLVMTIIVGGFPVAYNVDTGLFKELDNLIEPVDSGTYGIQNDGTNFFMAEYSTNGVKSLHAFTLDASDTATLDATISTIGAVDIAWDAVDEVIWCASRIADVLNLMEQYSWDGADFERVSTRNAPNSLGVLPASIKVNDNYVAVCWESGTNDPPTLGWNILTRKTGVWYDFWNTANTPGETPEALWPYTLQYWNTVTIEIDAPGAVYMTGYNVAPDWPAGYIENTSMRMLRLTPVGSKLSDGTLSDGTLSSN